MKNEYDKLEYAIGYSFSDKSLIKLALVHPSYRHENPSADEDNQRLEFLGDAALDLAAAAYLYRRYSYDEGTMTKIRSSLTCTYRLCEMARAVQLGEFLQLGRGEISSNGADRESTLADALEALIGAAYMDGGGEAVGRIFEKLFIPYLDEADRVEIHNPKGMLQEMCQKMGKGIPDYSILDERGPAHDKQFVIGVRIDGAVIATGKATSKSKAEREAAISAIDIFETNISSSPK